MLSHRRIAGRLTAALVLVTAATGCIDRPVHTVRANSQSTVVLDVRNDALTKLDLLLEIDNSNSMRENQTHIMEQLGVLIGTLTSPPCVSDSNPSPHACNASDPGDHEQYPAVRDMHVAVISSDIGTAGITAVTCEEPAIGDDGVMNPIRNGAAMQHHLPWVNAPAGFRPASCANDPQAYPSFLAFDSASTNAQSFADDFRCNAGLFVGGCAMEQQLESVWRALIMHDPHAREGNNDINAGFLRDDALLAIVMLTDEDDGSVRDCRYANGQPCSDATDVFRSGSTAWGADNLNLRMYAYQPGSAQDPTWPLDRYIDPRDASRGWLALKPNHPERIVFAAITGVPLSVPTHTVGDQVETDWDQLLGAPGSDPNDFVARDTSTAINGSSAEGAISMRQNNIDTSCGTNSQRVVPACRREGSTPTTSCDPSAQYFAWPSRRIVEIARRFDQAPLCNGLPCHNGVVTSICANDYSAAMDSIVTKIRERIVVPCLRRPLQSHITADGTREVECRLRETQPSGVTSCDASRGRIAPVDADNTVNVDGEQRVVCDIEQVGVDRDTGVPIAGHAGWFYQEGLTSTNGGTCPQRITFTPDALPAAGTTTQLECVQSVNTGSGTTTM